MATEPSTLTVGPPTQAFREYLRLRVAVHHLAVVGLGDSVARDGIDYLMDVAWKQMTPAERDRTRAFSEMLNLAEGV